MILCFDGLPGAGKSYAMHEEAFKICERAKKDVLVTNQPLNLVELEKYAAKHKMWHLMRMAREGRTLVIRPKPGESLLLNMLTYENSCVLLDEAAIFAGSRDYAELKKQAPDFLYDLVQVRKLGVDLIWSAQSWDMVDVNIRRLTNLYYECHCLPGIGDLRFPRPFFWRFLFNAKGIERFKQPSGKLLPNLISLPPDFGFFDLDVFKVYDSFGKFASTASRAVRFQPEELQDGWLQWDRVIRVAHPELGELRGREYFSGATNERRVAVPPPPVVAPEKSPADLVKLLGFVRT